MAGQESGFVGRAGEAGGPASGSARRRPYTVGEEIANGVTHGVGLALSAAALALLVVFAVQAGGGARLAAAIVYGATLVLAFMASTLYHSFPQRRVKHVFKVLDHAGIYLLIAGTYTPFLLVTLRGTNIAWMFWLVWGLALAGVATEAFWVYRPRWVSALVYLVMGWMAAAMIGPLSASLTGPGVALLAAGGLAYTLGTVFYVLKRVRYMHAVWHAFVLGGAVCHFLAVVLFVL